VIVNLKVIVAMSGGIDSSFALWLLLKQGYDAIGCYLLMSDGHEEDMKRAQEICDRLGVSFNVVDVKDRFSNEVIKPFIRSYSKGVTPNPCIFCNPGVKFKVLFEMLEKFDADILATGHYARIVKSDLTYNIARGRDLKKEQSYVLYRLKKEWLNRIIFPLGDWTKDEVKAKAREIFGEVFRDVPESADLCFLGEKEKFKDFIATNAQATKGPIISTKGDLLGYHDGLVFYTVGQREGLGLSNGPWYVLEIRAQDNTLVVGRKADLYKRTIICIHPHWLERPMVGATYAAQHRYKAIPKTVMLTSLDEGEFVAEAIESPFWGVAPGQSLVLYDGEIVVGGGIIASFER